VTSAATAALRLGTRRSQLAVAQTRSVARDLESAGRPAELVPVSTRGDESSAPLRRIGGSGVFVAALREKLLAGEVDVVVHSAKDLPVADQPGLVLAAVPPRADPRDALVAGGRTLAGLPPAATVGTGSPRRAAQLHRLRPDLRVVDIRGNVDTRLAAVAEGRLAAVVVAAAGLSRLDRMSAADELFEPGEFLPAPAQGALAVECREDDGPARAAVAALDDPPSRQAVAAERAVLAGLSAGCSAPVGAWAQVSPDSSLTLIAAVVSPDGSTVIRKSLSGPAEQAAGIGHRLAAQLLEGGAAELLQEI
jgi:hydroxymethylbilane synthase